jgi:hypothetical protein
MNPNLKEILKEELQKLLNAGFIYPISDSEWVSPLVIVPKKNGKWRVCVDYRALNKATQKDHFPLPFIDQVLDSLSGKKFFFFLDGFSGYNQIKIELEEKRLDAIQQTTIIQQQRSHWHNKNIKNKQFQKGNWALLYDSRFKEFQGKLRTRWLGPYEVDTVFPNGTVRLLTIDDSRTPLLVNGHRLRLYQKPISKEDFKATCMADAHFLFVEGVSTPNSN